MATFQALVDEDFLGKTYIAIGKTSMKIATLARYTTNLSLYP
jgi:hypothetical protein